MWASPAHMGNPQAPIWLTRVCLHLLSYVVSDPAPCIEQALTLCATVMFFTIDCAPLSVPTPRGRHFWGHLCQAAHPPWSAPCGNRAGEWVWELCLCSEPGKSQEHRWLPDQGTLAPRSRSLSFGCSSGEQRVCVRVSQRRAGPWHTEVPGLVCWAPGSICHAEHKVSRAFSLDPPHSRGCCDSGLSGQLVPAGQTRVWPRPPAQSVQGQWLPRADKEMWAQLDSSTWSARGRCREGVQTDRFPRRLRPQATTAWVLLPLPASYHDDPISWLGKGRPRQGWALGSDKGLRPQALSPPSFLPSGPPSCLHTGPFLSQGRHAMADWPLEKAPESSRRFHERESFGKVQKIQVFLALVSSSETGWPQFCLCFFAFGWTKGAQNLSLEEREPPSHAQLFLVVVLGP